MAPAEERQEGIYTLFSFGSDMVQRRWTCWPGSPPRIQHKDECMLLRVEVMPMIPCHRLVCAGCYAHCGRKDHSSALYSEVFREDDVAVVACTNEELASGTLPVLEHRLLRYRGAAVRGSGTPRGGLSIPQQQLLGAVKWSFLGGSVVCPSGIGAQPGRFAGASAERKYSPCLGVMGCLGDLKRRDPAVCICSRAQKI
ncbi:hypothetical protein V5799_015267 [Amblyomma americanum]|uniref:Uncharacterized protein n=1 Tax=Amblyomma americanum TaxID=6943 RepID=A0AAQ4E0M7_AMBAM